MIGETHDIGPTQVLKGRTDDNDDKRNGTEARGIDWTSETSFPPES